MWVCVHVPHDSGMSTVTEIQWIIPELKINKKVQWVNKKVNNGNIIKTVSSIVESVLCFANKHVRLFKNSTK